jgi:hypothetical protein
MLDPWIEVDNEALEELKKTYEQTMEWIQSDYQINLKSSMQIKQLFRQSLSIAIPDTKTETIEQHLDKFPENSLEYEVIQGIVYYQKMQYAIKNYIQHYLNSDGRVYLTRGVNGIEQTNHRPLPGSPEILQCITDAGSGLKLKRRNNEVIGLIQKGIKI